MEVDIEVTERAEELASAGKHVSDIKRLPRMRAAVAKLQAPVAAGRALRRFSLPAFSQTEEPDYAVRDLGREPLHEGGSPAVSLQALPCPPRLLRLRPRVSHVLFFNFH